MYGLEAIKIIVDCQPAAITHGGNRILRGDGPLVGRLAGRVSRLVWFGMRDESQHGLGALTGLAVGVGTTALCRATEVELQFPKLGCVHHLIMPA